VGSFFKSLKAEGIHTALDTCGLCGKDALDKILPYADMVLYDIKLAGHKEHIAYTGVSNEKILENLVYVHEYMQTHLRPGKLWIRTPVIPDTTATAANIKGIGKFIAEYLDSKVDRWELCAFNNLCKDKYLRLNLDWKYKDCDLLTETFMAELVETAKNSGMDPGIVLWSGSTKLPESDGDDKKNGKLSMVKQCAT